MLNTGQEGADQKVVAGREPDVIEVRRKKRAVYDPEDDEMQGKLEFDIITTDGSGSGEDNKNDSTLRKLKHMQNMLKKEGLSSNAMKDNIDEFEDVPAFVRKNIQIVSSGEAEKQEISNLPSHLTMMMRLP
ncbi:MAG: hypothetical protein R2744_09550 [Bacteroidales bacterium]